jgi:hypothetical protein
MQVYDHARSAMLYVGMATMVDVVGCVDVREGLEGHR